MRKESQIDKGLNGYEFSPSIRGKVEELVALLADEGFGVDGPPRPPPAPPFSVQATPTALQDCA